MGSEFLADGFDATDTAAQRTASLTAQRGASANANYGTAREAAGIVDPTSAIQAADDFLMPGASPVMNQSNNIADDSIESAVRRARSYLTDFNAALHSKQEIDAMIEGAKPAVQRQLIPIRNSLDEALGNASEPYAAARNTFPVEVHARDRTCPTFVTLLEYRSHAGRTKGVRRLHYSRFCTSALVRCCKVVLL